MHSGKHQNRRIVKSTIHLQVQVGSRLVGVLLVGMNTHLIVRIFDRSIDLLFWTRQEQRRNCCLPPMCT